MRNLIKCLVAVSWLAVGVATAAEVPKQQAEHTLVRVKFEPGDKSARVLSNGAGRLKPIESVRTDDGICFTGAPGFYLVSVLHQDGEFLDQVFQEVEIVRGSVPGPVDPDNPVDPVGPKPGPRPTGWAGDVFDRALLVNRPEDALKLAALHESFVSQFMAGGFVGKSAQELMNELGSRQKALGLGSVWRPFGDWLGEQVASRAIIAEDIRDLSGQISQALFAAGGKPKGKKR